MENAAPSLVGTVGSFFGNVLTGTTQSASDALGFLVKKKAGLIDQNNLVAGIATANNAAEPPQKPRDDTGNDNTMFFIWAGIAVVGLISVAAFFEDD